MSKSLSLAVLLTGLTLAGTANASAAQIDAEIYGDRNVLRSTSYGQGPHTGLRLEGDANDVEFFAGPCPGGRPQQTALRGTGQRRVLIAPCILD
jgi:hypothetical protein